MTLERVFVPEVEQSNAINAANDPECTIKLMARFYADCIRAGRGVDWSAVNKAIRVRWPKGLDRVKKLAWKEFPYASSWRSDWEGGTDDA